MSTKRAYQIKDRTGWTGRRAGFPLAAFDPALPQNGALILAEVLRGQFNGLKTLIDGMVTVDAAVVDSVGTLPAGDPAQAAAWVEGAVLHLTFAIPQGYQGNAGAAGGEGPQGPPFAQAVVDGVQTLGPGEPATVAVSFDGTNVHFSFGIPQGYAGEQGPMGEVTNTQMSEAINNAVTGTSSNSNAVATLAFAAAESYDQVQAQAMIDKMNELILALRR